MSPRTALSRSACHAGSIWSSQVHRPRVVSFCLLSWSAVSAPNKPRSPVLPRFKLRSLHQSTVCMASDTQRQPLKAEELPSPFMHERSKYNNGKNSLRSSLFEALRPHQQGLPLDQLVQAAQEDKALEGGAEETEVQRTLKASPYFFKQKDDKWSLSIFQPLKWSVVGTGAISDDVVEVVHLIPGAQPFAVAGRDSKEKAEKFGKKHGFTRFHANNSDLAADQEVELVYVSNVHTAHKDTCIPLLQAGKPVLCEKPLSVNAKDTKEMYAAADKAGKFFMAGLWSRFFPAQQKVRQLVDSGALGEVLHFHGEICLPMGEEVGRLYNTESGGGALLDIGLYMLTLASWTYGCKKPEEVKAVAVKHKSGVDVTGGISLRFGAKGLATLVYSMEAEAPIEATITGSKGSVIVHDRAHNPTKLTFTPKGGEPQVLEFPQPSTPAQISHGDADGGFNFGGSMGFLYELMAVHSAVVSGQTGYPDVSKEEMINVMEIADEIRRQIGVHYPQDE